MQPPQQWSGAVSLENICSTLLSVEPRHDAVTVTSGAPAPSDPGR
jgi:hypothetical protein